MTVSLRGQNLCRLSTYISLIERSFAVITNSERCLILVRVATAFHYPWTCRGRRIKDLYRFPIKNGQNFWAFAAENEDLPAWKYLAGKKSPGIGHIMHLCPSSG